MKFLKKLSSLPYKSAVAGLIAPTLVLLVDLGKLNIVWATWIASVASVFFGVVSIAGARNRK